MSWLIYLFTLNVPPIKNLGPTILPLTIYAAEVFHEIHSKEDHQNPPNWRRNFVIIDSSIWKEKLSLTYFFFFNTYNTFNEVKIFGHHVMEVISDEHSSNIQLNYRKNNDQVMDYCFLNRKP